MDSSQVHVTEPENRSISLAILYGGNASSGCASWGSPRSVRRSRPWSSASADEDGRITCGGVGRTRLVPGVVETVDAGVLTSPSHASRSPTCLYPTPQRESRAMSGRASAWVTVPRRSARGAFPGREKIRTAVGGGRAGVPGLLVCRCGGGMPRCRCSGRGPVTRSCDHVGAVRRRCQAAHVLPPVELLLRRGRGRVVRTATAVVGG